LQSDKLIQLKFQPELLISQIQETGDSLAEAPVDSTKTINAPHEAREIESLIHSTRPPSAELPVKDHTGINNDWITLHLVVLLITIAWIKVFFPKRLKQVLKSFYSNRHMNILLKEGNIFAERISIGAVIVFLVSFSLFIFQIISIAVDPGMIALSGYKLFAAIVMIVLAGFIIKNVVITVVGKIFKNQFLLSEVLLMNFIFSVNIGIWLLPLIILSVFLPSVEAIFFGIAFWLIMFVYKLFRQFFAGLGYPNFSLLNRFLYLCTLEIVPFLVIIKLIYSELDLQGIL
jgi:hypothetical protein